MTSALAEEDSPVLRALPRTNIRASSIKGALAHRVRNRARERRPAAQARSQSHMLNGTRTAWSRSTLTKLYPTLIASHRGSYW